MMTINPATNVGVPQQLASVAVPGEGFRRHAAAVVIDSRGVGDDGRSIILNPDAVGLSVPPASDSIGAAHDVANAMGRAGRSELDGAGQYPVPGRSAEYNFRVAGHEIGHCIVMRALSAAPIGFVEITRHNGYEGRCCRATYKPSQLNLEDQTGTILDGCARIEKLAPGLGSSRIESAELYIRAQTMVVELVAGSIAETILFPDFAPLRAEHDKIEARAVAALACASLASVDAMMAYAESEARNLINENLHVAVALVEALVDSKTGKLTGIEVDAVIEAAVARETQRIETARRADWALVEKNAAEFSARENGIS
jgi:hypothetical protein